MATVLDAIANPPKDVPLAEVFMYAKHRHERPVEHKRAIEVFDADKNMKEHEYLAGVAFQCLTVNVIGPY